MDEFEIVGWPEIQELMEIPGFEEHSALIDCNEDMGIGSSTYLIDKNWLYA